MLPLGHGPVVDLACGRGEVLAHLDCLLGGRHRLVGLASSAQDQADAQQCLPASATVQLHSADRMPLLSLAEGGTAAALLALFAPEQWDASLAHWAPLLAPGGVLLLAFWLEESSPEEGLGLDLAPWHGALVARCAQAALQLVSLEQHVGSGTGRPYALALAMATDDAEQSLR